MSNEQLADLTQPQRDRLAFIELRVRFVGEMHHQDLVTRFGIQSATASRDLALYKELAPGNIDYYPKAKSYVLGPDFQPVFEFPPERVLSWLIQGFGDGEPMRLKAWVSSGPGSSSWSWCRTRINPGRRSPRWITACVTVCCA
jgi:hypothetical protein